MRFNYFMRLLIALDQFFNVLLLGGSEKHTISGYVGYMAKTTNKKRWVYPRNIINKIFFLHSDHCAQAIEYDGIEKG